MCIKRIRKSKFVDVRQSVDGAGIECNTKIYNISYGRDHQNHQELYK